MANKIVEIDAAHLKQCDGFTALQRALHECRIHGAGLLDKIDDKHKLRITMELVEEEDKKNAQGSGKKGSTNVGKLNPNKTSPDDGKKGKGKEDDGAGQGDDSTTQADEKKPEEAITDLAQEDDPLGDNR